MDGLAGSVMVDATEYHKTFNTLIRASHKNYIDLETFLPWAGSIDKTRAPKLMDQLWIYGTPYHEQLTPEQRLEVAWLETARDASMFIHLEHVIPTVYSGYVNQYKDRFDPTVYEYLMLFSREELTHIMAFQRFLRLASLPWYSPPGSYAMLARSLPAMRPEVGIIFTLLIEWTAELAVMHGTQADEVEPFVRQIFKSHHLEEVRHIAFGKAIGEAFFARASEQERQEARQQMRFLVEGLHRVFNYNPEIAQYTSFTFPISPADEDVVTSIQTSEHNLALNRVRFKDVNDWCTKLGIL